MKIKLFEDFINKTSIIFLDLDGTINLYNKYFSKSGNFYKHAINILNNIIKETNCDIVISSNWRYDYTLDGLKDLFKKNKIIKMPIDTTEKSEGKVDIDNIYTVRAKEILNYVKEHNIKNWIAIDDYELKLPKNNFVKTDKKLGITEKGKYEEIINKLK